MSNRNDYRSWSPEEIQADTEATWSRAKINGMLISNLVDKTTGKPVPMLYLDWDMAIDRLGLTLLTSAIARLDVDGNPVVDENGKAIIDKVAIPPHRWSCVVKVEGHEDYHGTPIPKGTQYFDFPKQAANRVPTPSNATDLVKRHTHWPFTLEALLADSTGSGQSEQHRAASVVEAHLTGKYTPEKGLPTLTLDGMSVGAAGAIDTGKKKSATDDLSTDHTLLPFALTYADYRDGEDTGYGSLAIQKRVSILKEAQGASKRIVLRMLGKNVKGSGFTGYESAGNVATIMANYANFDEMSNLCYAYIVEIPMKSTNDKKPLRPIKVWEAVTAYACFMLAKCPELASIDSLPEYPFPSFDDESKEQLQAFLSDVHKGALMGEGPLADWCKDRVTSDRLKDSDESSFAQVLIAMKRYFANEPVTVDINRASLTTGRGMQTGAVFTHLGGGDRGPIPKKVKESK